MDELVISNNFTIEDIHKIREWNYDMMKSGKKTVNKELMLNLLNKFSKAKYIKLSEIMKEKKI